MPLMSEKMGHKKTPLTQEVNILIRFALILVVGTMFISACTPNLPEAARLAPTSDLTSQPGVFQTSTPPPENPVLSTTPTVQLPTPDPWDGKNRVTVLVLGLDYADWESGDRVGPPRSDTMILLTIDPFAKTAGVLSIPRDLWVTMPGFEKPNRINTAYRFGELYRLPGGGPGLAMRTVEHLLGIPINYFLQVDFSAFARFIDEIKGVKVYIQEPMTVSIIGSNKHVNLEPGWVTLPGDIALAYARSRNTAGDDFDRSDRQQQIIMAIRERILSFDMLPTLVLKAPTLYKTISDGIHTNLLLAQIIRLAWLAQQIPEENIKLTAIGKSEVIAGKSPDDEDIYLPIPERIETVVNQVFAPAGQELTREDLVRAENSRIKITNESGQPGLAEKTADLLRQKGLNVVDVVESKEKRSLTRLVDQVDDPNTLHYLATLLKVAPSEIWIKLEPFSSADMEIILGEDWAQNNHLE